MGGMLAAAPSVPVPNEALSDKNFWRLSGLVHELCGIKLTVKKKSMIDGRLRRRMRSVSISDINEYSRFLLSGSDAAREELVAFIDVVTTNKTDFFREPAHFVFMQETVMPSWRDEGRRKVKIWSAASSTGAEAYSTAMVIDDFFHGAAGFDFSILGTDICTDVLDKGRTGLYPDTMIDPIPEPFRRRYVLVPRDPERREFRIARSLRAKTSFERLNLMDASYSYDRDFDVIFLRNVLIYFDRPTQQAVLAKLCDHLRPGGYLFLGHSESLVGSRLPLDMVANTIFCRR